MKKAGKIVAWIFGGFLALGIIGSVVGDDDNPGTKTEPAKVTSAPAKTEQPAAKEETKKEEQPAAEQPKEEPKKEEPKTGVFAFGQDVKFDSGLSVKAVQTTESSERNQFADPVKHVVVVHFEFTNNTGAALTMTAHDFKVIDSAGFQGETYPQGDQLVELAPGSKARAEFHYGVDGEGPFKVVGGVATWE